MKMPRFNEESYGHFVTTKTFRNKQIFRDEKCCRVLLQDVEYYRKGLDFKVAGYVLMPDHLHMIVWWDVVKHPELTISKIMHAIKGASAKHLSDFFYPGRQGLYALPSNRRGIQAPPTHRGGVPTRFGIKIWQPSFYDFNIYSDQKLEQKLDYVHWNPVKAGLCKNPEDWLWSSYLFYATGKQGRITIDPL